MRAQHPEKGPPPPVAGAVFLRLDDAALIAQCEVDTYRSSGPGGQKRNKTSSAVRLRHQPTGLIVTATEERSQHLNRLRAIRRMREAIALNVRAPIDLLSYQLRREVTDVLRSSGLVVGSRDPRYYVALSEILDVLLSAGMRVSIAAEALGLSTAQLVKLLEDDPKVWQKVNELRAAVGAKPLR